MNQYRQPLKEAKNEWITFGLNFLFPGAGFLYLGEKSKNEGITFIVLNIIGIILSAVTGLFAIIWIGWSIFVLIYGFDATKKYNTMINKENWENFYKANEQEKLEQVKIDEDLKKIRCEDFIENMEKTFKLFKNELLTEDEFISRKEKLILQIQLNKINEKPEDFLAAIISLKEKEILTMDELKRIKEYIL